MTLALCAIPASAQIEIGDNISLRANGSVGFGYNGSFGNDGSNHGQGLLGDMDASGYYFHPNFLSFQFRPFYNRNSISSESQSVTRSTGVGASVSIFAGSRFPGSITYGRDFSGSSEFRLAGVPTISSDSSSQTLGIGWSVLLPKWPQLVANFSQASSRSSLLDYGDSKNSSRTLTLNASHQLRGWNMQAGLARYSSHFDTPAYLTAQRYSSDGSGMTYTASASHKLPLKGSFGLGWGHSNASSGTGTNYGTSNYSASNSFNPFRRLSVYQSASYNTNLAATYLESLGADGSLLARDLAKDNSSGLFYNAGGSYYLGRGISAGGYFNHRIQRLSGREYADSQYGGSVNFAKASRLFGFLNFSVGMSDVASRNGNDGAGLNGTVSLNRRFGPWETSADITYSQNVLTVGSFKTTSNYNYGGSLRRKVNRDFSFGGGYRSARTGLAAQSGSGNVSQSMSGTMQFRRYNFSGSYSISNGTALLNSSGTLTPTAPGGLFTEDLLLFNARSYSFSGGTNFFRRLTLDGGYAWFSSGTRSSLANVLNHGSRYNARMQYRLRRFQFGGGYNRSLQDVSTITGPPRVVNSFYLSFSRWFNVF